MIPMFEKVKIESKNNKLLWAFIPNDLNDASIFGFADGSVLECSSNEKYSYEDIGNFFFKLCKDFSEEEYEYLLTCSNHKDDDTEINYSLITSFEYIEQLLENKKENNSEDDAIEFTVVPVTFGEADAIIGAHLLLPLNFTDSQAQCFISFSKYQHLNYIITKYPQIRMKFLEAVSDRLSNLAVGLRDTRTRLKRIEDQAKSIINIPEIEFNDTDMLFFNAVDEEIINMIDQLNN